MRGRVSHWHVFWRLQSCLPMRRCHRRYRERGVFCSTRVDSFSSSLDRLQRGGCRPPYSVGFRHVRVSLWGLRTPWITLGVPRLAADRTCSGSFCRTSCGIRSYAGRRFRRVLHHSRRYFQNACARSLRCGADGHRNLPCQRAQTIGSGRF